MIHALLVSLALTLAIEVPAAWLLGLRSLSMLRLSVLVNCLTNPLVVYIYWLLAPVASGAAVWLPLETAAVLIEGALYRSCGAPLHHPFLFSLLLNALSYGLGVLIQYGGIL